MSQASEQIGRQMANGANVQRIWKDLIINVREYGAKSIEDYPGFDSTVAFQTAINYAIANGKSDIWIPPGTYKFGTLTNTNGLTFYGDRVALNGTTVLDVTNFHALVTRINNIVAGAGSSNTEVVDARQPEIGAAYPTLKTRLDLERVDALTRIANEQAARNAAVLDEKSERIAGDSSLNNRIDNLIINSGESNAEVADARQPETGPAFPVLKDRLDATDAKLADIAQRGINICSAPYNADATGATDSTTKIQAAIDALGLAGGGTLIFPKGTYKISSQILISYSNIQIIGLNAVIYTETLAASNYMFKITGSVGSDILISSNITENSTSIQASSSVSSIAAGDIIQILTNENYYVLSGRDQKKGELVEIASVNTSTNVLTTAETGVALSYTQAGNNLKFRKVNFVSNVSINGIKFLGSGTDALQGCVYIVNAKNITVKNCEMSDTEVGIAVGRSKYVDVSENYIHDINHSGTGYGIQAVEATQFLNVHHNRFHRNRHSFTTSGYEGVCMHIDVNHNQCDYDTNAGINTHGNARYVRISNNQISRCDIGISSYSPHTTIENNTIVGCNQYGIYMLEVAFINCVIRDNYLERGKGFNTAISIGNSGATVYEANEFIIVEGNTINDYANSSGIIIGTSTGAILVSVRNNNLRYIGYAGIQVLSGEKIAIQNNQLFDSVRSGSAGVDGITATCSSGVGIYGSVLTITGNMVYDWNIGIKVTLADQAIIEGNSSRCNTSYSISGVTNLRLGRNYPDVLEGALVWNPGSLVDGAGETSTNITLTGAKLGDNIRVYPPYSPQGMLVYGYVSAADTVNIRIQNETGGTIDLASGTWKVVVDR